jgi:hypothetical protein
VQVFDLADHVLSLFDLDLKHPGHAFYRLPCPRAHLRWVQLPLGRDLLNSLGSCTALAPAQPWLPHSLVFAQRLKRHSSLEIVSKVPSLRHL